jgi:glycosidase
MTKFVSMVCILTAFAGPAWAGRLPTSPHQGAPLNKTSSSVYEARMADWRMHQVVYQVFVDRFAAGENARARARFYAPPQRLRPWSEPPARGTFLPDAKVWSHEVDFWGGDLEGLTARLDYVRSLGANVLYLNPIFLAFTNHKYDATDYFAIDPQYGTEADFAKLCDEAHCRGMRVVLDGVFNHIGRRSTWFQEALRGPSSPFRSYFTFGPTIKNGYVGWLDLENLPELDYANPAVREVIYGSPESVVQKWLRYADGWRLDVAFDLGPQVLGELTAGAHRARSDSYTVGEIYNYPAGWFPALDGVMNMHVSYIIQRMTRGEVSGAQASEMVDVLVRDAGIEPLLRSWLVLSNHDRPRLKSAFPDLRDRAFLLALQVSLPGAPLVYYGEELGLVGKDDPENRGPMDWEAARAASAPEFELTRRLIAVRNAHRALQVGDFARIPAERLFAFTRHTASVHDTVVVIANPTDSAVTETVSPRDSWLMDDSPMRDLLSDETVRITAGLVTVTVPPKTVRLFVPVINSGAGYNRYKRVP